MNGTYWALSDLAAGGIRTFVVGLPADGTDDFGMNLLARAGGEARPGATKYYRADNQADFANAINTIAAGIISCEFNLRAPPPMPDRFNVVVGGETAPRDPMHVNGWDYGPGNASVRLYGSYCQRVQTGAASDVHAEYGCPTVGIRLP
jgi:hypothetical protein